MRNEIKEFIRFITNLTIIKNNIIYSDEKKAYEIICNAGYDFTSEEFTYIRNTLKLIEK